MSTKKTIIIGLPKSFDQGGKLIEKNLKLLDFDVINIAIDDTFRIKHTFKSRLIYLYKKHILKDLDYKSVLKFKPHKNKIHTLLNNIETKADYALLFRADIYPIETIQLIKSKSKEFVSYHWDGLNRFPSIQKTLPFFDRFYVFDPADVSTNFLPSTNFYFDSESSSEQTPILNDIYFMGAFVSKRKKDIENFILKTKNLNLKQHFLIYTQKDKFTIESKHITYTRKHISYTENLNNIKKSNIVIDFVNTAHKGLSFRVFEAIQFDKKLITNNASIRDYEFYNSNNIFIWTGNNTDELKEFISKKYVLNNTVKQTYSFSNWIKYTLNIEPFYKIRLPHKS